MTAPGTTRVSLPSGELRLEVAQAHLHLDALLDYAVRENPRRGFLFVSRVLGKHIPVAPSRAAQVWQALADRLPPLTHPHFIGLAETATALGEGVFRAWQARHPASPGTFQHTTRYQLEGQLLLRFDEPHSHAPSHLLYDPGPPARRARELVLIDDELSTGTTLQNLAAAWTARHPQVERVVLVSLTDWCPRREALAAALPTPVEFVSLTRGTYQFSPRPGWSPPALPPVTGNGADKTRLLAPVSARLGHQVDPDLPAVTAALDLQPGARVLVLGTGEYQFPPAQLAQALESAGHAVHWSATTRSPILPGLAITARVAFSDNVGDGIANYLYNVHPQQYDRILVAYEGQCAPDPALLAGLGSHASAVRLT
ncbi:phosphoribosyltransferase family protein (plasmid) [Deinococcus taeanensis]|uniref:phosphoribosyltransferase domain-containing protein n=1 Tax=Deinococcus taeanensis TaxID=2737050 RepID=UPI001CDBB5E8|nr:phosphoribosyltransferase domain-containing protein [Deinococcus taeanensis]UBV44617.1 phosphoribosyltransferase family protein [Deinococcus taeanensis]